MQNIIVSYSVELLKLMGTKLATQIVTEAHSTPSETKLWQAVVMMAFEDCVCNLNDKKSSIAKWDAFKWFHQKDDFENVCYLAEFEPEYVLERFHLAIDNEVIKFNQRQIAWAKYHEALKAYQEETEDKKKRKELRMELEKQRKNLTFSTLKYD